MKSSVTGKRKTTSVSIKGEKEDLEYYKLASVTSMPGENNEACSPGNHIKAHGKHWGDCGWLAWPHKGQIVPNYPVWWPRGEQ